MGRNIEVTDQAIVIDGQNTPLTNIINAEVITIQDWNRNIVIMIVALIGPILAMVVAVQMGGSVDWDLWFGPILLIVTAVMGVIGCMIGVAWKKPYGVVVEREEFGHSTLMRCDNEDEAASVVAKILAVVAK